MKHLDCFNPFIDSLKKNSLLSVDVESISIVPFIFSLIPDKKKVFICEGLFFDEIFSSFPQQKNIVALPVVQHKNIGSFYSYHEELLQKGINRVSADWEGVNVCVVDKTNIKKPLFPKKRPSIFSSKCNDLTYDSLLSFLRSGGYTKSTHVKKEGEYVLRGFIIDVFSFGEKKPIRINFFDDPVLSYLIDLDGNIIKKIESFCVFPLSKERSLSLVDFFNTDCLFVLYDFPKKKLFFSSSFSFSGKSFVLKKPFLSFDYQQFNCLKSGGKMLSSSWLLSDALSFEKTVVCPSWFKSSTSKDFSALPKNKLKLIEKDYYVHSSFGVCVFLGFEENSSLYDRVCFSFLDGVLKTDIKNLGYISYYASASAGEKPLNSLHKTKGWLSKKNKAFDSARDYVKNIVNNYALRLSSTKTPCVYREDLFGLFLSGFKYKDTRDQKQSWGEVLADMCLEKPMDRLLCGDVGFGKTEIALRAAFTALYNNKSVLVLSPTTILTQQLFECFTARLSPFGYSCFIVSRLTKNADSQIASFLTKPSSVLIGTHSIVKNPKLLKCAGLFIVDEEHRFGVKDKESVFNINPKVDYLSMSATPIPRSLQFSLSSVRDISVMLSPPLSRKPILTNILPYSFSVVKNISYNEISRGGQVFIVDNSIDNIVFLFEKIKHAFGGCVVSCLYGSQNKQTIKKTMEDFRLKKIDILISTTIIESGIDVPSANTLIVLNAHLFGLSQLYQLRGRVGRSNRQGYAYLFVPDKKNITDNGKSRLSAIQKNSSLGSGYNIALSDLDIRGPGSLFGYSQSGSSLVGFELYTKLLNQAVSALYPNKDIINFEKIPPVVLGSDYIPKEYIPFDEDRVAVYSFVSSCVESGALSSFFDTCILKFGPPPLEFKNLFTSRRLSLFLYTKEVSSIIFEKGLITFSFTSFTVIGFDALVLLLDDFFKKRNLSYFFKNAGGVFKFQFKNNSKDVYILVESLVKVLYE